MAFPPLARLLAAVGLVALAAFVCPALDGAAQAVAAWGLGAPSGILLASAFTGWVDRAGERR